MYTEVSQCVPVIQNSHEGLIEVPKENVREANVTSINIKSALSYWQHLSIFCKNEQMTLRLLFSTCCCDTILHLDKGTRGRN